MKFRKTKNPVDRQKAIRIAYIESALTAIRTRFNAIHLYKYDLETLEKISKYLYAIANKLGITITAFDEEYNDFLFSNAQKQPWYDTLDREGMIVGAKIPRIGKSEDTVVRGINLPASLRKNPRRGRRKNPGWIFLFRGKETMPRGQLVQDMYVDFRRDKSSGGASGPQIKDKDGVWWSVNLRSKNGNIIDIADFRYALPSDYKPVL